jgi:hypothetical protein
MLKKRFLTLGMAVLMLFSLAGLTACTSDIDRRHKGLSIGFSFSGPRYSQIMYAFRSDKTEFSVDDVTLNFYCGWFGELPSAQPPYTVQGNDYIVGVAFYITTSAVGQWVDPQDSYSTVENQHFLMIIPIDEFWTGDYLASQTRKKGKIFNHDGKSITIPKEAFLHQEETLELYAQIISFSYDDDLFHFDSSYAGSWYTIHIQYTFIGDNVVKLYR